MSSRVSKKQKKSDNTEIADSTRRRHASAEFIEYAGFEVMPCTRCQARGAVCKMVESGKKCGLCTRLGRPCDVTGVPLNSCACSFVTAVRVMADFPVSRIISEAKRIDAEELAAEELLQSRRESLAQAQRELLARQQELEESLARLSRLRTQRRSLISKGTELTRRNLESMDDLDEPEASVESEAVVDVQSLVHSDLIDWSSLGLGDFSLPSSEAAGGNPSEGVVHQ